jgi:hypothetical protein
MDRLPFPKAAWICPGPLPLLLPLLVIVPLLAACGDAPQGAGGGEEPSGATATSPATTTVFFTLDEKPVAVERTLAGEPGPEATLRALLQGPTADERAAGITSWFSEATGDRLLSVSLQAGGRLVVDFRDLREVIPNASSSTGSTLLLQELNTTLFQHPGVEVIEYRMEGSCQTFWGWLQYECRDVREG